MLIEVETLLLQSPEHLAKQKEIDESEKKVYNQIRNLYKKEYANGPGYNVSNLMSNIMKKSKIEFLKSVIMMRNGEVQLHARKLRSLVDLCVQKIIDNIRYLGNVGCVDLHLLEQILPHYTVDQLMRVEKGKRSKFSFSFLSTMYGAITSWNSIEKQSRQVRLCTKTPPLSKKRFWGDGPGYNVSNLMSNIMKKSKIEFLKR
ncbi:uncharacterized protein LOC107633282 [Arachis ipaensis]|uniref:uncharacterized protein LOC107633282 n=1 Tax=Arachis ipaensis TaxID=130454 RepID=UPI000A2B233E|nr:uncharacterized protein LOC107633282 [Arachis ipaensis]